MRLPRLLLLTDRAQLPQGRTLHDTVRRCVDAGLGAVVVRELDLTDEQRAQLVGETAQLGLTVICARTWFAGAVAVHLSAGQCEPGPPPGQLHGRSCHNVQQVRRAVAGGASYVTISPVARSASKPGYGPAIGAAGLRRAADCAGPVPVFALGGVDESNVAELRRAGAHGAAVMGAVMRADDPAAVVARLTEQLA